MLPQGKQMNEAIKRAVEAIRGADYLIALTGAGISKESNVPTFRGEDGLWKQYNAMDLATPQAFQRDPDLVWQWYAWRQNLISSCQPNPAHQTLAKWQHIGLLKALITQNVDGLHRRAGSSDLLEVHGNLWATRCTACSHTGYLTEPAGDTPICPECGNLLRPSVVWFGESLDPEVMALAHSHIERSDACIVVGTSALVQPAASFPLLVRRNGGVIIEINIETTPLTRVVDVHLSGKAGEVLPLLDNAYESST